MTKGTDLSGMKIWLTPSGKELRPAEVLAEDEGNTNWGMKKGYKC